MRAVRVLPLVLLLVLGGCDTAPSRPATPPELSANYTTVDGEYQQAKSQLDLPAGVAFPDHVPNTGDHYLPGSGANQAQNFWFCAWLRDYLDAKPDQTQKAVSQLPRYTAMSAYTAGLRPEGRAIVDAAIQGAQHGDKVAAAKFVESTCGGPFYSHASGVPRPS
jgi:hypothetical protein